MSSLDPVGPAREAPQGAGKANGPLVLVIEDSATMSEYIKGILGSAGYEVMLAGNGSEGLARVLERTPQLIILDMQMPELDGIGVLLRLRNRKPYDSIPVIVLTAGQALDDVVKACALGAKDYMTKPFDPMALLDKATRHAPIRRRRP